jgi:hypothetical protein
MRVRTKSLAVEPSINRLNHSDISPGTTPESRMSPQLRIPSATAAHALTVH